MKGKKLMLGISISIQKFVKRSLFKDTCNIKQTNLGYAFKFDFYLCTILKLKSNWRVQLENCNYTFPYRYRANIFSNQVFFRLFGLN